MQTVITDLFTSLAKCAACGASIVDENKGKGPRGKRYLVCSDARWSGGCGNHRM